MSQPDIATRRGATVGALPTAFASAKRAAMPSGSTATCHCEDLVWTELTYEGRTFEFNRGLHIRVTQEEGGCAFDSDNPELFGFGHTRSEAEHVFRLDFASQWDDLACEDDEKLTLDAQKMKYGLLTLVKAQR